MAPDRRVLVPHTVHLFLFLKHLLKAGIYFRASRQSIESKQLDTPVSVFIQLLLTDNQKNTIANMKEFI